ncbi:MAG: RNA polymerase sigma factor [Desulfobacterales bacterium]
MEAYASFYSENRGRVLAYLLRLTGSYPLASDLVQESFTRYLARYGRKVANRSLLFTIARNAALDAVRKSREDAIHGEPAAPRSGDPEHRLMEKQALDRVTAAIQRLEPVDRELIALLATEAFSYREIAKLLDITEANVKVKVHRARLRLRTLLKDGDL